MWFYMVMTVLRTFRQWGYCWTYNPDTPGRHKWTKFHGLTKLGQKKQPITIEVVKLEMPRLYRTLKREGKNGGEIALWDNICHQDAPSPLHSDSLGLFAQSVSMTYRWETRCFSRWQREKENLQLSALSNSFISEKKWRDRFSVCFSLCWEY